MRERALAFLLVLMIAFAAALPAGAEEPASPFARPPAADQPERTAAEPGIAAWLADRQRDLHRQLGRALGSLKEEASPGALLTLFGLSLLYGIFHAAGPGHGKVVVATYLLANERQLRRGLMLSALGSLFQALSAILLVLILSFVFGFLRMETLRTVPVVEAVSYGAIALVGLWLMTTAIRELAHERPWRRFRAAPAFGTAGPPHDSHAHTHHSHAHADHSHAGHSHGPTLSEIDRARSPWQLLALAGAIGLRPCSGAVLVLLLTLAQGIFLIGIAATFVMAAGTALTVAAIAALTVGARATALRLFGERLGGHSALTGGLLRLAAGLVILVFGAALLHVTLTTPRPII